VRRACGFQRRLVPFSGRAALALTFGVTGACRNVTDVNLTLERVSEARSLAADLLVQFTKSADAANRAVMADTDETSVAFAKEAGRAAETVQKDVEALKPLLQTLGYAEEQRLLDEFAGRYTTYRELDRRILDLAVENTNLKAQRLAFGPAQEAANAFRDALKAATSAAGKEAGKEDALALTAVTTVREIQVLQAPHIADADEAVMTRMEKEMATSETAARRALDQLRTLLPPSSQGQLRAATAALDKFVDLNLQIIALSRRNTNVRSLALSLDEKRKITTSCEESLHALQAALAKRGFTGIRER
jgi:chemoreceptor-like protein with four helix bundle sensory module